MIAAAAVLAGLATMVLLPAPPPRLSTGALRRPAIAAALVASVTSQMSGRQSRITRRALTIRWVDALVAELRAGRPPRLALQSAASASMPPCPRTVGAARLGGDVVSALRADAREQGQSLLNHVAACWSVAENSGAGLVLALEHVVASARADEEVRHEIAAQLAAPRATARLLAVLPIVGLILGTALGASPIAWLTGSLIGWVVLGAGLVGVATGLFWTSRMVAALERDLSGSAGTRARRRRTRLATIGRRPPS